LDVIDEAFEYLINQSSKGDKGQYFTPRYVIDMCVKMLNPQEDEYMIDTAAGSSGFPVHTIFHVWRQILDDEGLEASHLFSLEDKPPRCKEYVEDKVFAIDFDEKAVRVARTLNLIAGDGQTNVLHLNTLDYELWDEVTEQEDWDDIYHEGFRRLKKLRPKGNKDYREFQFDVLMANPPFAGDIKEPRMIARYDLAKKPNGKWQTKVGRDILFIERNLDFLKPGGRMAIVLPQGRFNNSSDKNIRDYIAERCRILAVVGLHGNTFKPHTGTKTSVLLVQKWNDDRKAGPLCPRQDDYNIFFATMRKEGKNNSGEKNWRKIKPSPSSPPDDDLSDLMPPSPVQRVVGGEGDFLQDIHGHLVVDHDLYNHEGLTEDGIAEAFIEFAKKEKFSFFEPSPSVAPFDAARYQRLMDGLEAAVVNFSEIDLGDRFDAEYFWKDSLRIQAVLKQRETEPFRRLGDFVASAFYPAATQLYEFGDTPFIRCVDCINYPLITQDQDDLFEKIPLSFVEESKGVNVLEKGDLVITKVGSPCFTSIVEDYGLVALSRTVLGVKKIINIDPYYLLVFLRSRFGFQQLLRQRELTIQYQLTLDRVKKVSIYKASRDFQSLIRKATLKYLDLILLSKSLYSQAEDLLLLELGLQDWQPTEETVAVKSFAESFLSSGRFDAEYYQPKFDQLIERLEEKVELTPLGDLLTLNQKGRQPDYIEEDEDTSSYLPVINSKYVRAGEVVLSDNRYAPIPEGNNPLVIQKGDVLFNGTGVGTVGRCAPYFYEQEALPDTEVTVLRSSTLDPVYLSIYINSIAGQLQVQKHLQGTSGIIRVYPGDIAQFQIWEAPDSIQKKIKNKVESSHQKREQSKQLLEIAKTGVERAIEMDEATATIWINEQLEALNIKLT
ncbi:MAG: N-6 DNA methylase, partial [Snowella sp.]|nr:N-6 DNA methylase [Snowella sp.]